MWFVKDRYFCTSLSFAVRMLGAGRQSSGPFVQLPDLAISLHDSRQDAVLDVGGAQGVARPARVDHRQLEPAANSRLDHDRLRRDRDAEQRPQVAVLRIDGEVAVAVDDDRARID